MGKAFQRKHIDIPSDLNERLAEAAKEHGITQGKIINQALENELERLAEEMLAKSTGKHRVTKQRG